MTAIADEILRHLAGASSRRPARADDVAALVGGDPQACRSALEQLRGECRINCAHIQRAGDAAPWLAIWPTGLPPRHDSWKDLNARGYFATHPIDTPRRFPQSPAVRREQEDRTMSSTAQPAAGHSRRNAIAALVAGRTLAQGLTLGAVADELGISLEGARYLAKSMLGGPRVARGRLPGERADRLYDPSADPDVAPPTSLADAIADMEPDVLATDTLATAAAQVADVAPPPARVEFALWDDGRISIYDGDVLLQLDPADTARLARLLGVPGHALAGGVTA